MVHRVHKASVGLVLAGVGLVLAGVGLVLAPACGGAPRLDGEIEAGDTTVIELGDTVFEAGDTVTVPAGEVLEGDLYAAGEAVRFLGQSIGDLVTAGISVLVDGPLAPPTSATPRCSSTARSTETCSQWARTSTCWGARLGIPLGYSGIRSS